MRLFQYHQMYHALPPETDHVSHIEGTPIYHLARHVPHHCEHSGYDALARYIGQPLYPSRLWHAVSETVLRPVTAIMARGSKNKNYTRAAASRELLAMAHAARSGTGLYHVMFADSDLRYLKPVAKGCRLIATFHIPLYRNPSGGRLALFRDRLAHVMVISRRQIEEMEEVFGTGRVTAVPHGVDCTYFQPAKQKTPSPLRVVFVGVHARDFQTLGKIARRLSHNKNYELTLITDRRGREWAEAPNIRWLQGLSASAYVHELQGAHVLLLPLLMSTANSAIQEGLACGLPVLTNPGGASEYVNESCAMLWPQGDADTALDQLEQLRQSPDLLARMSHSARDQALRHDWRTLVPQYETAFKKALSTD